MKLKIRKAFRLTFSIFFKRCISVCLSLRWGEPSDKTGGRHGVGACMSWDTLGMEATLGGGSWEEGRGASVVQWAVFREVEQDEGMCRVCCKGGSRLRENYYVMKLHSTDDLVMNVSKIMCVIIQDALVIL